MKKFLLISMLIMLATGIAFAAGRGQDSSAASDGRLLSAPLTFRVTYPDTATTDLNIRMTEAYNKITQLTNGELRFEIFHSGQLGSIPDYLEQMRAGAPIFCSAGFGNVGDIVPFLMPGEAPYLFYEADEVFKLGRSTWFANAKQEMIKAGIQPIAVGTAGFRHMLSRRPIYDASSIAGMRIRMGASGMAQGFVRVMGGAPVTSNWPDVYSMLQQGVIDATDSAIIGLWDASLAEVTSYLTLTGHFATPLMMMTSTSNWAKIPAPYQKIIEDCITEAYMQVYEDTLIKEGPVLQQFKDAGVQVLETDKSTFSAYVPRLLQELGYSPSVYDEMRRAIETAPAR